MPYYINTMFFQPSSAIQQVSWELSLIKTRQLHLYVLGMIEVNSHSCYFHANVILLFGILMKKAYFCNYDKRDSERENSQGPFLGWSEQFDTTGYWCYLRYYSWSTA